MTKQKGTFDKRNYEDPVAWLLGRQLMGSLKGTLLFTAFGNKIDPRDWMTPQIFQHGAGEAQEFWFDYIADSGDGMRATYSVAYLCAGDLWIDDGYAKPGQTGLSDKTIVRFEKNDDGENKYTHPLPRGDFLMVGGDTTYHMSDYSSLATRFQDPFKWAFKDRMGEADVVPARPLYGIPGNHDYYDLLDGFRRQFRKPVRRDKEDPADPMNVAQLIIPGFQRQQEASYFALKLPWDWWLWGIDTELGEIDRRQEMFFRHSNSEAVPDKLIVATCAPTTAFGKYARWEDMKSARTFFQLGLPWFFWSGSRWFSWRGDPKENPMNKEIADSLGPAMPDVEKDKKLAELRSLLEFEKDGKIDVGEGKCRLDISGDVHLYARYWGPGAKNNIPSCDNYASVVSGLGGAFHHPSYTSLKELGEQVLYPDKKTSLSAVAERLLSPIKIIKGGSVWLVGFVIAFIIYFGATVPPSSSRVVKNILPVAALTPYVRDPLPDTPIKKLGVPILDSYLGLSVHTKHISGIAFLGFAAVLLVIGVWTRRRFFTVPRTKINETPLDRSRRNRRRQAKLWTFAILNFLLVAIGFDLLRRVQLFLYPFESSMLVFYSLLLGAAAFFFCMQYSEWLFEKAREDYVTFSDWLLVYFVSLLGVVGVASGLWYFGKNNHPVYVITDILFVAVVLLTLGGLVALAWFKGGEMLVTVPARGRIFLVGIWHGLLQIAVPFLLVAAGNWRTTLAALIISVPAYYAGRWCLANKKHAALSIIWVLYGGTVLFLPIYYLYEQRPSSLGFEASSGGALGGWPGLAGALLAGVVGALSSCVWFGWYLAVCFLNFRGHNNEVGGAARIESFKQFIRFRLTEETLTGYVIAVDDVSMIGDPVEGQSTSGDKILRKDGSALTPRLIDVFQLSIKKSKPAKAAQAN